MNDVRQLIDLMQSQLVELFDQLRELRERLHLLPESFTEASPSILPLFTEVKKATSKSDTSKKLDVGEHSKEQIFDSKELETQSVADSSPLEDIAEPSTDFNDSADGIVDSTAISAKVSRVLDPIARELRTGEATADIIMEYLQSAKEYLIDDDERKKKVARDMDIVLNFLKARGKRGIRSEERDNILKRIRRWKAHLVSYSGSPAE
jgi:hypothetical protein